MTIKEKMTIGEEVEEELFSQHWNDENLKQVGVYLLEYMADSLQSLDPVRDEFKERVYDTELEPLLTTIVKAAADFMDQSTMTARMIRKAKKEKEKQMALEAYQAGVQAFQEGSESGPPYHFDSDQLEQFHRGYDNALKNAKAEAKKAEDGGVE